MPNPKIRISLFAYMMDKLAHDNRLTFKVGEQEYEVTLADFRMELVWADKNGEVYPNFEAVVKKPSEMN